MVANVNATSPEKGRARSRVLALAAAAAGMLRVRRDKGPIDTPEALARFVHTRAAFVAQKKLYGYLKARMGTRYPSMFEDDVFVESINIAKRHVFAACLSDICVHVVSNVSAKGGLEREEAGVLAGHCHEAGLEANRDHLGEEAMLEAWRESFGRRIAGLHWETLAAGADGFTESPAALYRWAPIDGRLKRHDREIVENSIRFAWAEFIREFRRRGAPEAIAARFKEHRAA